MGIGVSILLIAAGAVLAFAVHVGAHGIDLNAIGVILMVVGGIGLVMTLIVGGVGPGRRATAVDDGYVVRRPGRRIHDTYID